MKEIRITFKDEDFVAVSRSLVDLGVIFHVEPLEFAPGAPDGRPERRSSDARPGQTKKRQTTTAAKTAGPTQGMHGVGRLREMAERNRAASGEGEPDAGGNAPAADIPEDLSAKLLPYSERREG